MNFYRDKSMTKNSIGFILHDSTTIKIKGEKLKHRKFRTQIYNMYNVQCTMYNVQ
jgi:hypothetical protein